MFLGGWGTNGLVGVLAGVDSLGVSALVPYLPILTGTMTPDYLVIGPSGNDPSSRPSWRALGGTLAAGFWDNNWLYNSAIGYIRY